ncbi:MAG: hypothetical protein HQ522_00690 [Bacteroidetes bacterium]|nr:hypothetical protein [Bacteroidota bacterium]
MRQIPRKFTIAIPVKPYVKRFIELNYGYPVDFSSDNEAYKYLQNLLRKPSRNRDCQITDTFCTYTAVLEVLISEHDFYRYGWELTKTNVVAFGKRYEYRAKTMMRTMVAIYHGLGLPIFKSIKKFQELFEFEEDDWRYEAIKKDFYRNGFNQKVDFEDEIFLKIEKIILRNMYDLGTISKEIIKEHETSNKSI